MKATVYTKVLERAAKIVGGTEKLRVFLKVSTTHLNMWLNGTAKPPAHIFLKVVDIVSQESLDRLAELSEKSTLGLQAPRYAQVHAIETHSTDLTSAQLLRKSIELSGVATHNAHSVSEFMDRTFGVHEGGLVLQVALDSAVAATGAQFGSMQLLEPDGLHLVVQHGFSKTFLDFFACVRGNETSCAVAMKARSRVIVESVESHPIYKGTPAGAAMVQAKAMALQSTPLLSNTGGVLGVFSTHYDHPCRPSEPDLDVIDHIGERTAFWLQKTLNALDGAHTGQ